MNMLNKIKLCVRILRSKPGGLYHHAFRELPPADGDEMQELMNSQLLEIVTVFSTHGHSGFSAGYAANLIDKLLRYKPIGPLTGADSEWNQVADDMWQNRRCSHVFKGPDGRAYDINGKVFREPSGACFTNSESRVYVAFPYVPTTEYVDVVR